MTSVSTPKYQAREDERVEKSERTLEHEIWEAIRTHSSPTMSPSDKPGWTSVHGGQSGVIVWERDGKPHVIAEIMRIIQREAASARPSTGDPVRAALEALDRLDWALWEEGFTTVHPAHIALQSVRAALSVSTPTGEGEWEAHSGEDYTVVMRPDEGTDDASIRVTSDDREDLGPKIARLLNAALAHPQQGGERDGYVTWQQASLEQLARIKALIPASLSYEVPDPVEAIASTFREYVKVAGEATALRKQIAALRDGLGEPFMTGNSGCEGGPFLKLKYETLAETQRAHTALCEFFRAAPTSPSKSSGEEA